MVPRLPSPAPNSLYISASREAPVDNECYPEIAGLGTQPYFIDAKGFHDCTANLCALCAATGEQESVCSGAMIKQSLALVHHCDAFAREGFRCRFCFNATVACGQKYAELARREPHCTIRTENESAYSPPRTFGESALRCFWCSFCTSNAAYTCDERLYDRSKRFLCFGKVLRHVEVCNVGCSHRCCKCCHDEQLLALVACASLKYTAAVQEGCGECLENFALPLLCV